MKKVALAILTAALMAQVSGQSLPTGIMSLNNSAVRYCPAGFSCQNFTVSCPNIVENYALNGTIARRTVVNPVATDIFFTGHNGGGYWLKPENAMEAAFLDRLHNAHHQIVEISFGSNGWPQGTAQGTLGFYALSNRPATVIKWVHDNWGTGVPYNVTGGSEGAAAIGFSVAIYGVANVIDKLTEVSGPVMSDISTGCMSTDHDQAWDFGETGLVMQPWRYPMGQPNPCSQHDASWINAWRANSVDTGGNTYLYPNTKVSFILGGQDSQHIRNRAMSFYNVLQSRGQPNLSLTIVPHMGHQIQKNQAGLDLLFSTLTQ